MNPILENDFIIKYEINPGQKEKLCARLNDEGFLEDKVRGGYLPSPLPKNHPKGWPIPEPLIVAKLIDDRLSENLKSNKILFFIECVGIKDLEPYVEKLKEICSEI